MPDLIANKTSVPKYGSESPYPPGEWGLLSIDKHMPLWRRGLVKLGFKRFARWDVTFNWKYKPRELVRPVKET